MSQPKERPRLKLRYGTDEAKWSLHYMCGLLCTDRQVLKILKFFDADPEYFWPRIRDSGWKNSDPG
jgi:hypothetical protein